MDSITHIALGACIGEAFFENRLGKKAMAWGALAQSIPDIDFITSLWMTTPGTLLAHRGFTHSILFALLIIPLFAFSADRIHRPHNIAFRTWILFFASEVFLHLFIDGFNNYGVGWFEPFSHLRFSFNAIYVADPFFSIWPAIAIVALIILRKENRYRKYWWKFGVIIPFIYLGYCSINKIKIDHDVKEIFEAQHIPHEKYFTTPAPLQNWLWFVVAGNDSGYYTGYRSIFDSKTAMDLQYFPRNKSLLEPVVMEDASQQLIRFSQGFYTIEKWHDTLVFNDLRFGQVIGWQNPKEKFAFHYYVQYPTDNKLVVQRGRFAKWDDQVFKNLWKRIKGN